MLNAARISTKHRPRTKQTESSLPVTLSWTTTAMYFTVKQPVSKSCIYHNRLFRINCLWVTLIVRNRDPGQTWNTNENLSYSTQWWWTMVNTSAQKTSTERAVPQPRVKKQNTWFPQFSICWIVSKLSPVFMSDPQLITVISIYRCGKGHCFWGPGYGGSTSLSWCLKTNNQDTTLRKFKLKGSTEVKRKKNP